MGGVSHQSCEVCTPLSVCKCNQNVEKYKPCNIGTVFSDLILALKMKKNIHCYYLFKKLCINDIEIQLRIYHNNLEFSNDNKIHNTCNAALTYW